MAIELIIKNVPLFLSDLHDAREYTAGDGKPRWSAAFVVAQGTDNDKKIRAAIEQVARETWPNDWQRKLKAMEGQKTQYCYLDGSAKLGERYAGEYILATHRYAKTRKGAANTPPAIVDKNPRVEAPRGKIYPGCLVNAKVEIYAQTGENPGIRGGFSVVQYVDEGKAFGGGGPNVDGLDDLSVADEADIC